MISIRHFILGGLVRRSRLLVFLLLYLIQLDILCAQNLDSFFTKQKLGKNDSILVTKEGGETLFEWRAEALLIPASLAKLATAHVAIKKWGVEKQFVTDFYRDDSTLWVRGYGDPFLVSEELDLVVKNLNLKSGAKQWIQKIAIDTTHFKDQAVPGRSSVADPYNAPLSAVAANFNTANLKRLESGKYQSAEEQTPLTKTAINAARQLGRPGKGNVERVNLINADNAARNFAEILAAKLGFAELPVTITKAVPKTASLIYQHKNTRELSEVVRGTLEYSNNFMANQLFLMLNEEPLASFTSAADHASRQLKKDFGWNDFVLQEGAGLSRVNRMSARQIHDLLISLAPHRGLFKQYQAEGALVFAKTGTLNGVRSFAGYLEIDGKNYRFVFNFNRKTSYRYRERLMQDLVMQLKAS
ncbi:MAG: D-alanyl-D-alanine carboxypeptidase [Acidiferrobacterales bacterium]|nr:D-alanyl-D-alanine carboxypeptidase [Acidiferrobacterales bacterium]